MTAIFYLETVFHSVRNIWSVRTFDYRHASRILNQSNLNHSFTSLSILSFIFGFSNSFETGLYS